MKYSLAIHGGAGPMDGFTDKTQQTYQKSLEKILKKGKEMLESGKSSLKVVENCVALLENDPLYNAGKGSVLDAKGRVEMDAAIMNGADLEAGAVAAVRGIKNPIRLAAEVLKKSDHVMLIGKGAEIFADLRKVKREDMFYFVTKKRKQQLKDARKQSGVVLDLGSLKDKDDGKKYGTVGAVAMDKDGNLAAATSTGGIVNKQYGRVGDSPVIGSGVYANNKTCAVSCTGYGEQFLRTVMAKTISDIMLFGKKSVTAATKQAMEILQKDVNGLGGVIVVDKKGKIACDFTTSGMIRGHVTQDTDIKVAIFR